MYPLTVDCVHHVSVDNMGKLAFWFALIISAAVFEEADSAGTLEIELIKFNRLSYCCDPFCGRCDPFFYLCYTKYNRYRCALSEIRTGYVTDENSFYFKNERIARHFSLPYSQASFGIKLRAYDYDSFGKNDYIGSARIDFANFRPTPNGSVGKSKYVKKTLVSSSIYEVQIGIRAYCDVDYFGSDCNTFCNNNVNGHYTCDEETGHKLCYEGWTGEHCDTDIDECRSQNTCQNSGTCVNHNGTFTCNCPPGVRGIHCEHVYNHCHSNPCKNGGTCSQDHIVVSCQCPLLWGGMRCEESVNHCASTPCMNNASCDVTRYWPGYRCKCLHHWEGQHCNVKKAVEFLGDTYMITLNGVIDDTNRKKLDVGIERLSRDLGRVYVKTLPNILQIKPGLEVTIVTFYMSRDDGPVKYNEIDAIFTNHTTGVINSYLPLPLYDHKDVFDDESFSWNEILLIVVCVLIFVVCVTLAVVFVVRRRNRRKRSVKERVKYQANPQYDLIDLNAGDLIHSDVMEPSRGDSRHRREHKIQSNDSLGGYDRLQPENEYQEIEAPAKERLISSSSNQTKVFTM